MERLQLVFLILIKLRLSNNLDPLMCIHSLVTQEDTLDCFLVKVTYDYILNLFQLGDFFRGRLLLKTVDYLNIVVHSGYSIIQLPEMVIAFCGFIKNWKQDRILIKLSHKDHRMNTVQNMRMSTNSTEDSTINVNRINIMQIQRIMDKHLNKRFKRYASILEKLDKFESNIEQCSGNEKHSNIMIEKKHGILAINKHIKCFNFQLQN